MKKLDQKFNKESEIARQTFIYQEKEILKYKIPQFIIEQL